MRRFVFSLILGIFIAGLVIAAKLPPELDTPYIHELWEKAKKEGGWIYSYGMPDVWANYGEIFKKFEEFFGIKHRDIDMGSSVVLARMTQERASKNDIADLKPSLAMELARRGLTAPYKPINWEKIPPNQRGQDPKTGSVWQAVYKGTLGFLVNTDIVKNIPRTWKDLKNPAYKNLIIYLDPRATGTGVNTIEAIAYALTGDPYNYKAAIDFLRQLHDMGLILSVDPKVSVSKWERGEAGIVINFDYNLLKWKYDNPHINSVIVIPEDGTISSGGGVIIAKNAPHPYTARLFMEYLLSYGQKLYAKGFVSPMVKGTELPEEVKDKFPPAEAYKSAIFVDYIKDREVTPKLQEYYSQVIGSR